MTPRQRRLLLLGGAGAGIIDTELLIACRTFETAATMAAELRARSAAARLVGTERCESALGGMLRAEQPAAPAAALARRRLASGGTPSSSAPPPGARSCFGELSLPAILDELRHLDIHTHAEEGDL